MDDETGVAGAGPLGGPPEAARAIDPEGSPGHKCRAKGCECWVHDDPKGTKLCQTNCPGGNLKTPCCNNGFCGVREVGWPS